MPSRDRELLTVSPPTLDRTAFQSVDKELSAPHAPFARDWLLARFAEGLQIRMLRAPAEGFVVFHPGRQAWRPIEGAEEAVVVHDLRAAPGSGARDAVRRLWTTVEDFARYYGYGAILAVSGHAPGLISPDDAPARGWSVFDEGPGDSRLLGRVLQGPIGLPRLARDWVQRAARVGRGIVIQTTGESAALERRRARVTAELALHGETVRHDRLPDAATAQARAVTPSAIYSVLVDGVIIGGPELDAAGILGCLDRPSALI